MATVTLLQHPNFIPSCKIGLCPKVASQPAPDMLTIRQSYSGLRFGVILCNGRLCEVYAPVADQLCNQHLKELSIDRSLLDEEMTNSGHSSRDHPLAARSRIGA